MRFPTKNEKIFENQDFFSKNGCLSLEKKKLFKKRLLISSNIKKLFAPKTLVSYQDRFYERGTPVHPASIIPKLLFHVRTRPCIPP
jgi:hypothetical protein